MNNLQDWMATEARFAAIALTHAVSATTLVKERPGFGQTITPKPGSILASPIPASYDPDPDYFFHWFRDSAIVVDALRLTPQLGLKREISNRLLCEFAEFCLALRQLNGEAYVRNYPYRLYTRVDFIQYLRDEAEISKITGSTACLETRVNADGSPDISKWPRPQADGPALRMLALMRWMTEKNTLAKNTLQDIVQLMRDDIECLLTQALESSFDIWEEENGFHYYTQLVQTEALEQAASWLISRSEPALAKQCYAIVEKLSPQLDAFWDPGSGFYHSRRIPDGGDHNKLLDISVILAVIHTGRSAGAHSVLDPKAQATLTALEELFEVDYVINHKRPPDFGPALGRYHNDAYYSGGAYFFSTLAGAEFYFRLAKALSDGAEIIAAPENERFRQRLGLVSHETSPASAALARGESMMRTVQAFAGPQGELSEQFDQTTGVQTSAKHLTWSYAAFITAYTHYLTACQPIKTGGI